MSESLMALVILTNMQLSVAISGNEMLLKFLPAIVMICLFLFEIFSANGKRAKEICANGMKAFAIVRTFIIILIWSHYDRIQNKNENVISYVMFIFGGVCIVFSATNANCFYYKGL